MVVCVTSVVFIVCVPDAYLMRASSGVDATLAALGVHSISTERSTVHTPVHRPTDSDI